jgi:hypothetical protein
MALPTFMRRWNLVRKDTLQLLQGQFEAEEVTEGVSAAYTEQFTLNRQTGILQFLHGETDTVSFRGRFYDQTITGGSFPLYDAKTLPSWNQVKEWIKIDPALKRPPVLIFFIGDGHLQKQVVIQSITGVKYDQPSGLGAFKGVTFTLNLVAYTEFSIDDTASFDTRYHHALEGDYYELLAQREYRNPLLGVWLRQQHPTQPNLQAGNVVKLPAPGGGSIRTARVTQRSVVFETSYGRKPTPQRDRRLEMLRLRNAPRVSHIIPEGL